MQLPPIEEWSDDMKMMTAISLAQDLEPKRSNCEQAAYDLENCNNMYENKCVVCKKDFMGNVRVQKYCSLKCCLNDWEKHNPQR